MVWAHADRRVLVYDSESIIVSHVGPVICNPEWSARNVKIGGIGALPRTRTGVATNSLVLQCGVQEWDYLKLLEGMSAAVTGSQPSTFAVLTRCVGAIDECRLRTYAKTIDVQLVLRGRPSGHDATPPWCSIDAATGLLGASATRNNVVHGQDLPKNMNSGLKSTLERCRAISRSGQRTNPLQCSPSGGGA